jgi:hypothetical protein
MEKAWDLNIYFVEDYNEETDETTNSDTLRINPALWMSDGDTSNVEYSNWYIDTTFAETRYLVSQYPEDEYGYDWTDSLEAFLEIAPPRLKSVLLTLPPADEMDIPKVKSLVG